SPKTPHRPKQQESPQQQLQHLLQQPQEQQEQQQEGVQQQQHSGLGNATKPSQQQKIEVMSSDQHVLDPLRAKGGAAAELLVRLVLSGRGRASQRLRMLRYLRSLASEASLPQVFILRGPPGLGKSSWASAQLRAQVGLGDGSDE
ncbi:unnamed protein product, partial [Polarella glacialis]